MSLDIAAAKKRCEAATAGEWKTSRAAGEEGERWVDDEQGYGVALALTCGGAFVRELPEAEANAEFIAHARTDLPAALKALEEAKGELRAVEKWADEFALEQVREKRYELDRILRGTKEGNE